MLGEHGCKESEDFFDGLMKFALVRITFNDGFIHGLNVLLGD